MMMALYWELVKETGVDVVGVEYSGYGAAQGKPSASNTLADLEAAYDLVVSVGVSPARIVVYGQSVGSGPVSSLASKKKIGGVVLHSPLLSGIKVVDPAPESCCRPSCVYTCFDFYHNDKHIKTLLDCPVLVMHGQRDDTVPFYHGRKLASTIPSSCRWPPYFPESADHNDIVERDRAQYYHVMSKFLQEIWRRSGHSVSDQETNNPAVPPNSAAPFLL